jgi:peptidoglycan/LPS O-acetylase OafA/YrhL
VLVLALSQNTAEGIIGLIAIAIGLAVCAALWWYMVARPWRDERRRRAARSNHPRADGRPEARG